MLSLRNKIRSAWKYLAHTRNKSRNMLDTVQDLIFFIIKYDIAVLSHQFHGKRLSAQISHFIQMFNLKPHHAFQTGLVNLYDPAILDMLSE